MKSFNTLAGAAAVALIAAACVFGLTHGADMPAPALLAAADLGALPPEALVLAGFGGLIVNAANLSTLYTSFKTSFNKGLGRVKPQWDKVATPVPSTSREENYGWMGKVPNVREWLGDRVVQNIMLHKYAIANKDFELTLGVPRNDIDDDQYGIYGPLFEAMGESTGAHPDQLVFALLAAGFSTVCYDGQYFFDTDHPVIDADGVTVNSVANTDGGSGTAWYLMDTRRFLKPLVYQTRKPFGFQRFDKDTDPNVFMRKEFLYGADGRSNVGFGFWQFAWGSKQTLNKANYKIAREALSGMKGDHGRPLGIMPGLLVVPSSLEGNALEIVNAERDAAGATNVYKGTAEVMVCPWLA